MAGYFTPSVVYSIHFVIQDSYVMRYDLLPYMICRYLVDRGEAHLPLHTANLTQTRCLTLFLIMIGFFFTMLLRCPLLLLLLLFFQYCSRLCSLYNYGVCFHAMLFAF